jgi:uncharacterized protein
MMSDLPTLGDRTGPIDVLYLDEISNCGHDHAGAPFFKETHVHYLLIYELCSDYLERRAQFRDAHLALAWEAAERGEIVIAGALDSPADRAILLFDADSPDIPAEFARNDPYVTNGLVDRWEVRKWNTVVGDEAASPVRPAKRL